MHLLKITVFKVDVGVSTIYLFSQHQSCCCLFGRPFDVVFQNRENLHPNELCLAAEVVVKSSKDDYKFVSGIRSLTNHPCVVGGFTGLHLPDY